MFAHLRSFASRCRYKYRCNRLSAVPLSDIPGAWYAGAKPILWAYAGGGHLCTYGNCREAIEKSISLGFKVLELDVAVTSDGIPVLSHWFKPCGEDLYQGRRPSLKEFLAKPIAGRFTPWTLDDLLRRMTSYDGYVSLDPYYITRSGWRFDLPEWLLVHSAEEVRKRIIYQVPNLDVAARIAGRKLGFASLHHSLPDSIDKADFWRLPYLARAVASRGIKSVSIGERMITEKTRAVVEEFRKWNIHLSVAGVDTLDRVRAWEDAGAEIFNSRHLIPSEVERAFGV